MTAFTLARNVIATLAVVAIPIAVNGAEGPSAKPDQYYTKRICEASTTTGSRLGTTRRCRTKAERDQAKAETRRVIERVQTMKPTFCGPGGKGC